MPVSVEQFVESLSLTGLMTADELQAVRDGLAARKPPPDAETLARELVRDGKLTKFQARALYEGKAKGLVCGDYVLLDRIGVGGMGQVYKARHQRMNRTVALKVLVPHATTTVDKQKAVKRFYQEVELAARLVHPNIVVSYDAGEANGLHYLVMELVEGQDLAALLKPDKKLPLDRTLDIILQAARGLEYAHGQGIIHRDIKPSNLLLDKQGKVKILDMGLARAEQALAGGNPAEQGLTGTGEIMGTVDYMAPEQGRNTREADARCDIYSLGCTLYRLATGQVPFDGRTLVEKILAHSDKRIPSLAQFCGGASPRLERAFQRMLAKQAEDRFQSMREVIAELEACRANVKEEDHSPRVTDESPMDSAAGSRSAKSASGMGSTKKSVAPIPPPKRGEPLPVIPLTHEEAFGHKEKPARRIDSRVLIAGGGLATLVLIAALAMYFSRSKPANDSPDSTPVAQTNPSAAPSQPQEPVPQSPVKTSSAPAEPPKPQPAETASSPSPPASTASIPAASAAPATPVANPPAPAASVPPIPAEGIDLLKLVDLKRDVSEGAWNVVGTSLVAAPHPRARLQLPYTLPTEYDLHTEIETLTGSNAVIGLPVGSSRVGFYLAQGRDKGSGLDTVDGKRYYEDTNPTRGTDTFGFAPGQRCAVVCQVRPTSVLITLNGRPVVDWKGDCQQLNTFSDIAGPDRTKPFLYASNGVRFNSFQVLPPGGTPRPKAVEVLTGPPRPGVRVNLLRLVDLNRDVAEGDWTFQDTTLVTPNVAKVGRLQFPYTPPAEYELHVELETFVTSEVGLGLVVGSSRMGVPIYQLKRQIALGAVPSNPALNPTVKEGMVGLSPGKPITIVCRVEPTRVHASLNGQLIFDWKGDPQQFPYPWPGALGGPDKTKLFIYTFRGGRFLKYELLPLGGQRKAAPADELAAAARAKFKDLVGELPTDATAARKSAHAANLHYEASLADEDDALRYALLTEAAKQAVAADDLSLAIDVVEDLARCFEVDALAMFEKALEETTNAAAKRPLVERKKVLTQFIDLADQQLAAERYDVANLLVKSAAGIVAKSKEPELQKELQVREQEAGEWQKLWAAAKAAEQALAANRDSADAHLAVGQYLACARSQWPEALVHLAKGSDPLAGAAAQVEAQAARDPSRAAEIGTAWLSLAEKASIPLKVTYLEHARAWFTRGAAGLKKGDLTKLLTRFKKVETDSRKAVGLAFLKRHPLRSAAFGNHWFQFIDEPLSWHAARQRCQEMGGDLAALDSPAKCQFAYQLAAAQHSQPDVFSFWIGATEEGHDGVFTWGNGTPVQFSDWANSQPGNKADQAVIATRQAISSPQFKWGDVAPSQTHVFICEWER